MNSQVSPTAGRLLSYSALAIGIVNLLALGLIRLISASVFDQSGPWITALGVAGLLTLVPIAAGVVLSHLALGRRSKSGLSTLVPGVALGVNYVVFFLYINRMIVAAIATATYPSEEGFLVSYLNSIFFWA